MKISVVLTLLLSINLIAKVEGGKTFSEEGTLAPQGSTLTGSAANTNHIRVQGSRNSGGGFSGGFSRFGSRPNEQVGGGGIAILTMAVVENNQIVCANSMRPVRTKFFPDSDLSIGISQAGRKLKQIETDIKNIYKEVMCFQKLSNSELCSLVDLHVSQDVSLDQIRSDLQQSPQGLQCQN